MKTLSREEARRVYNRIGKLQDSQAFYEAPAIDLIIDHGHFATAQSVFEFGCGTGRLPTVFSLSTFRAVRFTTPSTSAPRWLGSPKVGLRCSPTGQRSASATVVLQFRSLRSPTIASFPPTCWICCPRMRLPRYFERPTASLNRGAFYVCQVSPRGRESRRGCSPTSGRQCTG